MIAEGIKVCPKCEMLLQKESVMIRQNDSVHQVPLGYVFLIQLWQQDFIN